MVYAEKELHLFSFKTTKDVSILLLFLSTMRVQLLIYAEMEGSSERKEVISGERGYICDLFFPYTLIVLKELPSLPFISSLS